MQQQSSQSSSTFSSNPQDITAWIKGVRDPVTLSHVAREVFGQIETLDSAQRQQIYTQLQNDVKFQNAMGNLSPQTA